MTTTQSPHRIHQVTITTWECIDCRETFRGVHPAIAHQDANRQPEVSRVR